MKGCLYIIFFFFDLIGVFFIIVSFIGNSDSSFFDKLAVCIIAFFFSIVFFLPHIIYVYYRKKADNNNKEKNTQTHNSSSDSKNHINTNVKTNSNQSKEHIMHSSINENKYYNNSNKSTDYTFHSPIKIGTENERNPGSVITYTHSAVVFLNSESYKKCNTEYYAEVVLVDQNITPWNSNYVYRKEDINRFTSDVVVNSYNKIRNDFLKGIVYNLNDERYYGYAFVLMFDILDSIFNAALGINEISNILTRVHRCCAKTGSYIQHNLIKLLSSNKEINEAKVIDVCRNISTEFGENLINEIRIILLTDRLQDISETEMIYVIKSLTHSTFKIESFQFFYLGVIQLFIRVLRNIKNVDPLVLSIMPGLMSACERRYAELVAEREVTDITLPQWSQSSRAAQSLYKYEQKGLTFDDLVTKESLIELNRYYSNFCKKEYSEIKRRYKETGDVHSFVCSFENIASNNTLTPNIYVLYENAIRDIYKVDTERALIYYCILRVYKPDEKIGETYCRKIFKGIDVSRFESSLNTFIEDVGESEIQKRCTSCYENKWLFDAAIKIITESKTPIKKQITIDIKKLQDIESGYNSTVSALDRYLSENEEKSELKPLSKTAEQQIDLKKDILELFKTNSFIISKNQFDIFVKNISKPTSVIINDINESYYEILDDNLIEETDDSYFISNENFLIIEQNG